MEHRKVACSPANPRSNVTDASPRGELTFLAKQSKPKADIDILMIAKIPLIKSAALDESVTGIKRSGATWSEAFSC